VTALSWCGEDVLRALVGLGGRLPTGGRGPVAAVEGLGFSRQVASVGLLELMQAGRVTVEGPWVKAVEA
jgi:hypothetical protein